jgi:catechol 2,3-dioxygenase-like lactoylglutathione lyase family enzyme
MGIKRLEHAGIVVEDLEAAVEFFVGLGLEVQGRWSAEGDWVGSIIGLEGVETECAMLETADGGAAIELVKFNSPPAEDGAAGAPSNALGIRHLAFLVDDLDAVVAGLRERGGELVGEVLDYQDVYRLCYARGPEGILVELAERLS